MMNRVIHLARTAPRFRGLHAALVSIGALVACAPVLAQTITSLQVPDQPLMLKARGSFYVGGVPVEQSDIELGSRGPADRITVDQMYVEYMVPMGKQNLPVVMIHGAGLSGKSYDTTPDGRMGWFEYFVRKSHPVYVVDQVGRARSGFNQAMLNRAGAGEIPREKFPKPWRFGDRNGVWKNFRFGPEFGQVFPGSQFPVQAIDELSKQSIPDLSPLVPTPNPTHKALANLASSLGGAVLLSHSQSGHFPMEAALLSHTGVRAIVAIEPGICKSKEYSDEDIARLAELPTLIVFGDYLPVPTGFTTTTWEDRYQDCSLYASRIRKAKGKISLVRTSERGIRGNSHMLMHDRNSLQIADLILDWLGTQAQAQPGSGPATK